MNNTLLFLRYPALLKCAICTLSTVRWRCPGPASSFYPQPAYHEFYAVQLIPERRVPLQVLPCIGRYRSTNAHEYEAALARCHYALGPRRGGITGGARAAAPLVGLPTRGRWKHRHPALRTYVYPLPPAQHETMGSSPFTQRERSNHTTNLRRFHVNY